jgi:hypothetical protein
MQAGEAKLVDGIYGNLCILSFSPPSSFIIRFERLLVHPPTIPVLRQYYSCRLPRAECVQLPIEMSSG